MLVVDAGCVVDLLLDETGATHVRRHLSAHSGQLAVPAHLDMEVMNAVRSLHRGRAVNREEADGLVSDLLTLNATRHPLGPLALRMWQLADNVTPYDAAYVALAEQLDAPLLTGDARLARAVERHTLVTVLSV